jgi:Leucine-rich repeat (LRR) protein
VKRNDVLKELECEREERKALEDLQAILEEVTRPVHRLVVYHAWEVGEEWYSRPYYNAIVSGAHVTELYIDGKHLLRVPESIGNLERLEKLNLSENLLKALPESMGRLKSLRELDLSHNELTTLPEWVGKLKDLEGLVVNHNRLSKLPDSIVQLRRLERLYVYDNEIAGLPGRIEALGSLNRLRVWNNRLSAEELERIRRELPASTEIAYET